MLCILELIRAVSGECGESRHPCGVHVEGRHVSRPDVKLEARSVSGNGGHCTTVFHHCARVPLDHLLYSSFERVHRVLCWSVGWYDHNAHAGVCVGAIDLFHGPCVSGVRYAEYSSPLKWATMGMVVVCVASWHLEDCHVEILPILGLELENVLTGLHVEYLD